MGEERNPDEKHGGGVKRPEKKTLAGLFDIVWRIKDKIGSNHLSIVAAGVSFYSLLAIFPGLAALVSMYGLASDPLDVPHQIQTLKTLIPPVAYNILENQLQEIAQQSQRNLSFGFFGGLFLSIWSANKGVKSMMEALNIVYEEKETRGIIKKNLFSLLYTFLAVCFMVIILITLLIIPSVLKFLNISFLIKKFYPYLQWPFLAALIILILNFTYRYFPDRKKSKWKWVSYGSFFSGIFWIIASVLFSFYVVNFGNFNKMYGPVGAIIVLMLWFYLSAYIMLLGGELNSEIERRADLESESTGK